MSNSPLVSYTLISPCRTSPRTHKIDTITIHCVVGQLTIESIGACFKNRNSGCSANYGIGRDGKIGLFVEEKDRSWASSNAANDHRAITIECASNKTHPYAINDKVYASLIKLLVDICERNGIERLLWKGDKSLIGCVSKQNMTVHRWFAKKACPGDYIYNRLGQIASDVNSRIGQNGSDEQTISSLIRVKVSGLRVRSGPGTTYEMNSFAKPGVYTIIQKKNGPGSNQGWGKLKSGAGWVSLDFVEMIS